MGHNKTRKMYNLLLVGLLEDDLLHHRDYGYVGLIKTNTEWLLGYVAKREEREWAVGTVDKPEERERKKKHLSNSRETLLLL